MICGARWFGNACLVRNADLPSEATSSPKHKDLNAMLYSLKAKMLFVFMILPTIVSAEEMTFDVICAGMRFEACYIEAQGTITPQTPELFRRFYEENKDDSNQVLLNSSGGNLGAGLTLGRMFRELKLNTIVGKGQRVEPNSPWMSQPSPEAGRCESACAYAFLGGLRRSLSADSQIGFHRFYLEGREIDGQSAQVLSGDLITYLVKMGVDARVFTAASKTNQTSMHFLSDADAKEYDVITPYGFTPFFLDPYGSGVVAASKRLTRTEHGDYVQQVTAFCRNGQHTLMFFAPEHFLADAPPVDFFLRLDRSEHKVDASRMKVRATQSGAYLDVQIPHEIAAQISKTTKMSTWFGYGKPSGGSYPASFDLSGEDRKMISAAFKLCI